MPRRRALPCISALSSTALLFTTLYVFSLTTTDAEVLTTYTAKVLDFYTELRNTLDRFSERITRVEVHLSDEDSDKKFGTHDKRCMLEGRIAGLQTISVSHQAETLEQAVEGAVKKLKRSLDSTLGRLRNR